MAWHSTSKDIEMKLKLTAIAAAFFCGSAFAQTGALQRDVNQQERIEQGLKSGQLTTGEAARLEREEAKVERDQARALRDGSLSPAEKARLAREQNKVSRDIYREKHDAQTGDPNSPSSQRMQADVQRDVNQQRRIEQGVASGELTNREAARLERGQARDNAAQARAGADGNVGPDEQRRLQHQENRQSRRIYREKHDVQKQP
jgi:hypothetical protein